MGLNVLLFLSVFFMICFLVFAVSFRIINSKNKIYYATIISAFSLYTIMYLVSDNFTGKGIDESVIYHLISGLKGTGFAEYLKLISYTSAAIILSLFLPFVFIDKVIRHSSTLQKTAFKKKASVVLLVMMSFVFSPTSKGLYEINSHKIRFQKQSGLPFNQFYKKPRIKKAPSSPPNLVYIYTEGLERTYFDNSVFPDLMTGLSEIEKGGIVFDDIQQVYATGWTIAGIVSSQCGIPLICPSTGNSMGNMNQFMPNAVSMSDLLSQYGYHLEFLQGTSGSFAGNGNFLRTHSFDKVYDKDELLGRINNPPQNSWGLYDSSVFNFAMKRYQYLSSQSKPFGLFISTMDTHHPKGHLPKTCDKIYGNGKNPILNAVKCSDQLISFFVQEILSSYNSDNTVIVIASDHLAMKNTATDLLDSIKRSNLLMVISPTHKPKTIYKKGTTMDIAPTVLYVMGFNADVGLGRNLMVEDSLLQEIPDFNSQLKLWQDDIIRFWGFPVINNNDFLKINILRKTISFKEKEIQFPILMEFDKGHNTTIKFPHLRGSLYPEIEGYDGFQSLEHFPQYFLLIDKCQHPKAQFCMTYGLKNSNKNISMPLTEDIEFTADYIFTLTRLKFKQNSTNADIIKKRITPDRIIAHAGGAIDGHVYTNCLEALDLNYSKGFRKFELDILKTSDGHLVAAHDWKLWKEITNYQGALPPDRCDFLSSKILGQYTPLDIKRINLWFQNHPDASLVTDKINAPMYFASRFIDKSRLTMELFSTEALCQAKKSGVSSMANWSVLGKLSDERIHYLKSVGVSDVAVSRRMIKTHAEQMQKLRDNGIRVFVYHVNADPGRNEQFVICNDMDIVYGMYADELNFNDMVYCEKAKYQDDAVMGLRARYLYPPNCR